MDNILRDIHWNTNTPKQNQLCLHSSNMLVSCVRGWDACIAFPDLLSLLVCLENTGAGRFCRRLILRSRFIPLMEESCHLC